MRSPLALLTPFAVFFLFFFIAPIGYALYQSFTVSERGGLFGQAHTVFAGFGNYIEVLQSPEFGASVLHVLEYAVIVIPVMVVVSVGLALVIDAGLTRLARPFQFILFLPYAVPGVIAVVIWGFLYIPQLNPVLGALHDAGLFGIDPLSNGVLPFSFANINLWLFLGYNVIILTAALRTVPKEIVEAATVDGASLAATALRIKLPMIRQAVVLILVFTVIGAFQLFNEPQILRGIGAEVSGHYTPNLMAYTLAFADNDYSQAATVSVLLAVATAVVSFAVMRVVRKVTSS